MHHHDKGIPVVYMAAWGGLAALTLFSLALVWFGPPSGLPAHAFCWKSSPGLIFLHLSADLLTWGAYSAIPLLLVYLLVIGKVDRSAPMTFPWLVVWAILFIWVCGQAHLLDALEIFWQVHWQRGIVKLLAGVIAWIFLLQLIVARKRLAAVARAIYRAAEEEEGAG